MADKKRLIDADELSAELDLAIKQQKGDIKIALMAVKLAVDFMNPVDAVEVVHGRWIHKGAWHIECSECQHVLAHISEAKNYCPNCGAKMDNQKCSSPARDGT